ncbi:MAG TPA: AAA family ATPase [Polyangiaceae bacterium]|nr:AAA family ATPase [Polyangiaceae bacterium]
MSEIASADYQKLERVSVLGSAVLWRARRRADGALVLIQELDAPASSPRAERLLAEYELLKGLELPGVLRPTSWLSGTGTQGIVFEHFAGQPLELWLETHDPDWRTCLRLASGLAQTLGAIHGARLIHGDVRPANVLVSADGAEVRVFEFTRPAEVDWAYVSPEQTGRMNRAVDQRTDFYSLGVTLYRLLTGTLPFRAEDPLELAHAHVARLPTAPASLRPELPAVVSALVLKLLAKDPDERYQSAHGVLHDLERCLASPDGALETFELGSADSAKVLRFPRGVYGRERELAALLGVFHRVADTGRSALTLVSGHSGIGKSVLVHEIGGAVEREGGNFVAGKFDQAGKEVPYSTIADAFRGLVQRVLAGTDQEIGAFRQRLSDALGVNGAILVALVPRLSLVLGSQPPVPELPPLEAKHRFQLVFRRFVSAIARAEQPLVLFLDDLQWADSDSLSLVTHLLSHPDTRHLLVVGAYRDNEVDASHPLLQTVDALRAGVDLLEIPLPPLDERSLLRLVTDSLRCAPALAEPLIVLLHKRTGDNPFFVKQLLRTLQQQGLIVFDPAQGCWTWELSQLREATVTDDVVELMTGQIERLPAATRDALKWAACIGARFDLDSLALCWARPLSDVAADLAPALEQDLIALSSPAGESYHWLHDRIQQAAYSLIPSADITSLHLTIGRRLLAGLPAAKVDENPFTITNHLNLGATLLDDRAEKLRLAELNLASARKARTTTAYASGLHYCSVGVGLMDDDAWERHYELAYGLHMTWVECGYLAGLPEEAVKRARLVVAKSKKRTHKAAALRLCHDIQLVSGEMAGALSAEVQLLELFGVVSDAHPGPELVAAERERVWTVLAGRPIEAVVDLPALEDPELEAAMYPAASSFWSDPQLFMLHAAHMVSLSIEHGNSELSPFWYASYGSLLTYFCDDAVNGYRFANAALELTKKQGTVVHEARVRMALGWVGFSCRPMQEVLSHFTAGWRAGVESGDLSSACICLHGVTLQHLARGDALDRYYAEAETWLGVTKQAGFHDLADAVACCRQFALALMGRSESLTSLRGEQFDPEAFEAALPGRLATLVADYWILQQRLCFVAGDYAQSLALADKARPFAPAALGGPIHRDFVLYHALALAQDFAQLSPAEQQARLKLIQDDEGLLGRMAQRNPGAFLHAHALVRAEHARVSGRESEAAHCYQESLDLARAAHLTAEEALVLELAARFYETNGFDEIADLYWRLAWDSYARWGASGKTRELERSRPRLRDRSAAASSEKLSGADRLDLSAIVKASQSISGEIVLDRLIETLMRTVVESAGAQKGSLILARDEELVLAAEARVEQQGLTVQLHAQRGLRPGSLPLSLLNYVHRSRERVLLADAGAPSSFSEDAYLSREAPKSVLCLPIIRQTEFVGLLYLENNLLTSAFTPERLTALELLASQAAISLDNARLFAERQRAEERFSKAFHASPTPMAISRVADDVFVDINEADLRLLGRTRDEIVGKPATALGLLDPEVIESLRKILRAGGTVRDAELQLHTKSGAVRTILVSLETIELGGELCTLTSSNDITERKQVEEQLRQSQKMEAIGRFAGGIAHDFNNLLTAINGYSALALMDLDPAQAPYELVREILKSGERAAGLTHQLLAYGRKQILEAKDWDLNVIVADLEPMLRRLIGEDVGLSVVRAGDMGLCRVDRGQIEQIILNLVVNARDAMPEGGKLTIATRAVWLDQDYVATHLEAQPGPHVLLTVSDTGKGMAPDVVARIFEPFFTTKEVGKGTGLGLSVVYGIVKQSGGTISVYSEPGRGTTFNIYFPEVGRGEQGESAPPEATPPASRRGTETLLLVEDDEPVRLFAARALEAHGYTVIQAKNGVEALELLPTLQAPVDLVITDVVMPDMGGLPLAKRLRELGPYRLLFMSGYAEQALLEGDQTMTGEAFLQKPFSPSELARRVRAILDQAKAR